MGVDHIQLHGNPVTCGDGRPANDPSFQQLALRVGRALSKVAPFRVRLERLRTFRHSARSFTAWVDPQLLPAAGPQGAGSCAVGSGSFGGGEGLVEVQRLLELEFPECHDLSRDEGRGIDGFVPHLSLGQLRDEAEVKALEAAWTPIEFLVDGVQLISRKGYLSPFTIRYHVPLGLGLEADRGDGGDCAGGDDSGNGGQEEWRGIQRLDLPYIATTADLAAGMGHQEASGGGGSGRRLGGSGSAFRRFASPCLVAATPEKCVSAPGGRGGGSAHPPDSQAGPAALSAANCRSVGLHEVAAGEEASGTGGSTTTSEPPQPQPQPHSPATGLAGSKRGSTCFEAQGLDTSREGGGAGGAVSTTGSGQPARFSDPWAAADGQLPPAEEGSGAAAVSPSAPTDASKDAEAPAALAGAGVAGRRVPEGGYQQVWWFAYGAAAGCRPSHLGAVEAVAARLPGYRLAFNRRGGRANLLPVGSQRREGVGAVAAAVDVAAPEQCTAAAAAAAGPQEGVTGTATSAAGAAGAVGVAPSASEGCSRSARSSSSGGDTGGAVSGEGACVREGPGGGGNGPGGARPGPQPAAVSGVLFRLPADRLARLLLATGEASPIEVVCEPYGPREGAAAGGGGGGPGSTSCGAVTERRSPVSAVALLVPPQGCLLREVAPSAGYIAAMDRACDVYGMDPEFRAWLGSMVWARGGTDNSDALYNIGADGRKLGRWGALRTGAKKAAAGLPRDALNW